MHELSICQALLTQVDDIAARRGAESVERIEIEVGPLAGVEPELLEQAFLVSRLRSRAASAVLNITTTELHITCELCGARSRAPLTRILCKQCGSYRTRLVSGDELRLRRVVLVLPATPPRTAAGVTATATTAAAVAATGAPT